MTAQTSALEAAIPQDLAISLGPLHDAADKIAPSLNAAPWVPVRVLGPRHRRRIQQHLLGLDSADRVLRFGHAASDAQIERYVQSLDFLGRDGLFGVFDRGLTLVALGHLALSGAQDAVSCDSGEFGVSVSAKARGRGLGRQLFAHTVTHARNRGAKRLVIYLARNNLAMLAIVRRAQAEVTFDGSQAVATLALNRATLGTQVEAMVEAQAAEMDFQIKLQVQRLDRLWPNLLKRKEAERALTHDRGVPAPFAGSNISCKLTRWNPTD